MVKILITGASSYVGSKIYVDLKKKHDVIGTYEKNKLFPELISLDILNRDEVIRLTSKVKPSIIIHIAAIASSVFVKQNPELATKVNVDGTKNVVDAANLINAKVIFMSSFAAAAIRPTTYAQSKIKGEELVKETRNGYVILRPSLVIGLSPNVTNDRLMNRVIDNITKKVPAIYDTSWKFQPTWLNQISEVIEKVIEKDIKNKIIHISLHELVTRYDLTRDILSKFNIKVVPKDDNDTTPTFEVKQDDLKELGIKSYSYNEMVDSIVKELKQYLKKISLS